MPSLYVILKLFTESKVLPLLSFPPVESHNSTLIFTEAGHQDIFYRMWNAGLGDCTVWYNEGSDPSGEILNKPVKEMINRGINASAAMLIINPNARSTSKIGMNNKITYSNADAVFRTPKYREQEAKVTEDAMELLKIFGLEKDADLIAGNLPYGAQRRLEIARAMATEPKLLLLDEPAAGMNPQETADLMDMIRFVRDHFRIAILLIEHDMKLVMGICERISVLNYGMLLAEGTPAEIQANPQVIKAYLGE